MWGVFIIKEFQLTPKGQFECGRRQDVNRVRLWVFLRPSVSDSTCDTCLVLFYFDNDKKYKSWGQVYLTVSPSGSSRWFHSTKSLIFMDFALDEKREKMCFCWLSAGKCPPPHSDEAHGRFILNNLN